MKAYKNKANQSEKKRSIWFWLIPFFVVVAVLVSGLLAAKAKFNTSIDDAAGGTFTARRDDLTITVTEGGSIRAHKSIEYKCRVERGRESGELTILSVVSPGTYVTQEDVDSGKVLVQLDSSAFEERLIQEKMELAGDQEAVTSATKDRDIQIIQNESDIAEAELKVRFALLDLQKYLGAELAGKLIADINEVSNLTEHIAPFLEEVQNDPNMLDGSAAGEELKRLQDDITMALGNLKNAEDTLAGTIKLHDANYVSDLERQKDELTKQNREFALESARVALNLFKEYDFPKTAEQYLSDYIEAGRQLKRVHAQCDSRLAQAQVRLSSAQERLFWQERRVKEIMQNIEYCTIKAQAPGLVVYGTGGSSDMYRSMRYRGGGSSGIIAEGETVTEGQTILSMPDTATMIAEISVHETEIDKVQVGQAATIVMDAFPDRVLEGEVTEVGSLPDQQRGFLNPDLKVYKTLVTIDGSHDFLKSRMSCKVTILVDNLEDVIIVPIQVVSNRRGKKVCYVLTDSGPEEREVRTGLFNDMFVQVIEGLDAGDEVMLNPPLFSETSGPATFQQQQLPRRRGREGAADSNDPGGPGRGGAGRGARRGRRPGGGRTEEQSGRPPQEGGRATEEQVGEQSEPGRLQLTDGMIDRIMAGMRQFDPEKAKDLEELRKSDPEKFKSELQKSMQSMRNRMRQGGGGMGQGGSRVRQGQGNAGSGQNR
jgi:HlyD family secretion protein